MTWSEPVRKGRLEGLPQLEKRPRIASVETDVIESMQRSGLGVIFIDVTDRKENEPARALGYRRLDVRPLRLLPLG